MLDIRNQKKKKGEPDCMPLSNFENMLQMKNKIGMYVCFPFIPIYKGRQLNDMQVTIQFYCNTGRSVSHKKKTSVCNVNRHEVPR